MKLKFLQLLIISIISTNTFSQTKFLKAYFVNNSGQKIECYIKNVDWRNNPTQFEYKLNENEKSIINNINDVKEFYILDNVKYIRETVDIDTSPDNIQNYSNQREPIFKTSTVFLKVLIEGSNSLYSYNGSEANRLFYTTKTNQIEQLIYKKYYSYVDNQNFILENDEYKKQLLINVKCAKKSIDFSKLNNLKFNTTNLVSYFNEINICQGDKSTQPISLIKKPKFNINAILSINNSSLKPKQQNISFGSNTNIGLGFELELILPINNYSWSLFVEPTYNDFKSDTNADYFITNSQNSQNTIVQNLNIDARFRYIQLPFGFRKYFYLNKKSNLFINAAFNVTLSDKKSKVNFSNYYADELDDTKLNYLLGIGYQFNKFYFEFRYFTGFEANQVYNYNKYIFSNTSLTLKYNLF